MTEPEQPDSPALTRRRLREIRNTASTPIIAAGSEGDPAVDVAGDVAGDVAADTGAAVATADTTAPGEGTPPDAPEPKPAAPLPRAAEPVVIGEAPVADAAVDLTIPAMTRRQARQQERLRTASVPVIGAVDAETVEAPPVAVASAAAGPAPGADAEARADADAHERGRADEPKDDAETPLAAATAARITRLDADEDEVDEADEDEVDETGHPAGLHDRVSAGAAVGTDLPPSFDQLLTREGGGTSSHTQNALILSQTPESAALTAPVTAGGDMLITGSLTFPAEYGETGVHGAADGADVDAVLVDGEIPAASSPTPIAASSAISTIKSAEDIIRPPAPEKGGRLMMVLAITAGVLALALAGVLILAFATGAL